MINIKQMFPVMVTPKLEEQKAFYQEHFGFQAVYYQKGFYLHLIHQASSIQLGFLTPDHDSQPGFLHSQMCPEGFVISFEVADAASEYQQTLASQLSIVMELKTESWGQKHFILEDPAGFRLDIVEHC